MACEHNIDDSLNSVARAIAESVRRPVLFPPGIEDTLESMLGPQLAERFSSCSIAVWPARPTVGADRKIETTPERGSVTECGERRSDIGNSGPSPEARKPFRLLTFRWLETARLSNIVQVAMSLENVEATRSRFLLVLLILAPVALAGSALGGWFLARRALSPVDAMVEAARRIEAEDLTRRHPRSIQRRRIRSPGSRAQLTCWRDSERSFGAARQFSADAAHELRTPLTILKERSRSRSSPRRLLLEIREALVSCLEEVDRLNSLVEDLLLMARMEGNALSAPPTLVNLAQVLEDVAPALSELAARAGNSCTVSPAPPLWIEGYDSLLFRLVFNLAENAIKYTPPGGKIEVNLQRQGDSAVLDVKDNGPGIAADTLEHIFDRFYRGDPAREGGGTGLGLALVRSIVQLHQGQIRVSSTLGEGSCFQVILPLAPHPSVAQTQD